jgi:hypothetical protein
MDNSQYPRTDSISGIGLLSVNSCPEGDSGAPSTKEERLNCLKDELYTCLVLALNGLTKERDARSEKMHNAVNILDAYETCLRNVEKFFGKEETDER